MRGTETELWSRARDGEAFGAIFDRHRDRVLRHARRLVESQHDAEDVVAGAFLELWRRRRSVRELEGSVLPWLLVTTTNVARNRARALRRYRSLLDRLPRRPEVYEPEEIGADLAQALAELSTPDVHLLILVSLEGYPVKDAAGLLGLTETAARSRLHRARARARATLTAITAEDS